MTVATPDGAAPPTPAAAHEVDLRLSWGECDPAGIVYYATYLEWAERVHGEWWFLEGIRLDEMAERWGAAFVVRHVTADYLRSPRVLDPLRASLVVEAVGRTSFTVAVRFSDRRDGAELGVVRLVAVFVGAEGTAAPVPDPARSLLTAAGAVSS